MIQRRLLETILSSYTEYIIYNVHSCYHKENLSLEIVVEIDVHRKIT